jgi:hypothetical protein
MQPARLPPQRHLIIRHSFELRHSDFVILLMFFGNPGFVSWQEMPEFGILPTKHPPSHATTRQARRDAKI